MKIAPRNRVLLAFAPYAVVGAVHLAALAAVAGGADAAALVAVTKPLLMPLLLLAFLLNAAGARRSVILLGAAAITLSWVGDVALMLPGEGWFLAGLCGFLVAHVFYVLLIVRHLTVRRLPLVSLAYVGWWIALVALLAPHVGWLVWPLAGYGIVLGLMAVSATRAIVPVGLGGFLFLFSDTVLAVARFMPSVELWQPGFTVMLTYIAGQGLIIAGAVRHLRAERGAAREPVSAVLPVIRVDSLG
ncbi:lysoplasmalogenase [Salinibacterium sp. dk2585]|uniref:lysoplasmalogenase n=1 Tax=unclassified Salinibacterium TaxID=2632331 RepID=UPI0011C25332|nr:MULTISPECIES: lysoplasmalogenase [unclassified Salinibacterium]QEE61684.1 lysoplasmalogenase [Salinibacterium sp. dk2585]TXK54764.1 lysoplasmalogenase [Salinibacterium sp. dk5596]